MTEKGPGSSKGGRKQRREKLLPLQIGAEALKAFEELKQQFLKALLLRHYAADLPIRIETDASGFAISAIISQPHPSPNGKIQWHPIAFYSRKMTAAERNYHTGDQEMLAIVEAFEQWRSYLEGALGDIQVITDHANLVSFMTTKPLSRRQVRFYEWLTAFDFRIVYRRGSKNPANGPSRRPDYIEKDNHDDILHAKPILQKLQDTLSRVTPLDMEPETPAEVDLKQNAPVLAAAVATVPYSDETAETMSNEDRPIQNTKPVIE